MSDTFKFNTRDSWETYFNKQPHRHLTIWELVNYPLPKVAVNDTKKPSHSYNKKWSKLSELRSFSDFNAQYIRPMLGPAIYELETRCTHDILVKRLEEAERSSIQREGDFDNYCTEWFKYIINAIIDAIAKPVGVEANITWNKRPLPRAGGGSFYTDSWIHIDGKVKTGHGSPTDTEYDTMDGTRIEPSLLPPGKPIVCVVGEDKLSRNWSSSVAEPYLDKGAQQLLTGEKWEFAPLRQVATYSSWGQTRWNIIFTDVEVVIGRAYKVQETEAAFLIYDLELDAPDDYLGLEIASIQWAQAATPDRLSALEGIMACIVLSFQSRYRQLVRYDQLHRLNRWFSIEENGRTYYQHSLTRTITVHRPDGVELESREFLLTDNSNNILQQNAIILLTTVTGHKTWK